MKNTLPGILEKAFPGIFDSDSNKPHNSGLSEDFFYQIAQNARDMIMHAQFYPEFRFDYVSPSCFDITGYTPEEFYADPMLAKKCWHPDDLQAFSKQYPKEKFVLPESPQEIRWIRKDGSVIWIEHLITPSKDKAGNYRECQIFARDITARKKTEEAFQETQIFTNSLLEHAPHATVVINADTSIRYVNPTWEKLNGWTLSEVIGIKAPYPWWPADQKETWMPAFLESFKQKNGRGELPAQKKNGEIYWIDMTWTAVCKDGEVDYLLINSLDITERKNMEAALAASEEKFARTFRGSPEIISICTFDEGRYLDVNESYCQSTGYTREEVVGKTVKDINIWLYESESNDRFRILKEQGRVSNKEYSFRTKSGDIRTWLYSAEMINVSGESCLMNVSIDITERKAMEQALANEAIRRRILIEQSTEGIVIIDETGEVHDVNWSFAEMLGYNMEEASRLHIWDWEKGFTPQNLLDQLKNIGSDGNHYTSHFLRKDGSYIDVDISMNGAAYAGQKLIFCVCHDISERNRMEKALRESESKFALAFNASPHMFAILDMADGKYLEVNDSFLNHTGYTREELIGKTQNDVNLWANPDESDRMIKHIQDKGSLRNEEYEFRNKSGEIRTWLCSADIVNFGGRQNLLAIAADITERKQAEALLRDSEEKFSRAFNASPISLSISRMRDTRFLEVNESFLRDKGYTREDVIGRSSKDMGIWASVEEQAELMHELKANGHVHNKQMRYYTKQGAIRTGLISAELISLGNEPCMLILNSDITQQKQAEEQLRLLGSVTQQVSDSTIIVDPDFKITYMNKATLDMFGYPFEEVKGQDLAFFDVALPGEAVVKRIQNTLREGKMVNTIVTKKRKDGSVIISDCRLSPMYDEQGNIVSFIDVMRDITKEKDIETKLQEHKKLIDSILATMPEGVLVIDSHDRILLANKAIYNILHINGRFTKNKPLSEVLPLDQYFILHRAITTGDKDNNTVEFRYNVQGMEKIIYCVIVKMDGERTLMTFSDVSRGREEEEKLYLTDRLASIGEMAAGLAHELNNPLTGILTLSQILVNSEMSSENKEDMECIYSEAKRAAGIVKNVLLFARNKPDDSGQASANDVIKDVLRLREYEERSNNIKVITELEEDLPDIAIDKGQLQQIILNMLSNAEAAIKEADRPGIITVTTQRVNSHINLTFSDNGCGIKKQILPRIFDPFFTTKEVGKGTGLGLSICYSIVVKHGGKINVKSQVDEGTTFTIRMPVAQ